jgi:hypothetical protein
MESQVVQMIGAGGDLAMMGLFVWTLRMSNRLIRLETLIETIINPQQKRAG